MVVAQVPVHRFALQDGHRAGRLAEAHGVDGNQAVQVGEPVHQCEPDGSGIEAAHAVVGVMLLEILQGMDACAIVLQEIIADPDDRDRKHAEVPRRVLY